MVLHAGAFHAGALDTGLRIFFCDADVALNVDGFVAFQRCELGSALSYVQEKAKGPASMQLKPSDKVVMAHDIVKGMAHLIESHFVHRDLAARNVLVDSMRTCKVADFGLSRAVAVSEDAAAGDEEEEQYYRSVKGQFPVRWTAPEAMETNKFDTKTDVWSFGVTLVSWNLVHS